MGIFLELRDFGAEKLMASEQGLVPCRLDALHESMIKWSCSRRPPFWIFLISWDLLSSSISLEFGFGLHRVSILIWNVIETCKRAIAIKGFVANHSLEFWLELLSWYRHIRGDDDWDVEVIDMKVFNMNVQLLPFVWRVLGYPTKWAMI